MSKELDEFEEMYNWIYCNCGTTYEDDVKLDRIRTNVKRALQRLEAIDNAKPSDAMEDLKELHELAYGNGETSWKIDEIRMSLHIKQSLLKAQEQAKVLEVIDAKPIESGIAIEQIKNQRDYSQYKKVILETTEAYLLTEEEFDLLKRWYNG